MTKLSAAIRSTLLEMPVAGVMAIALAAGFVASTALGVRSVGGEALQFAGTRFQAPARFLWFYRDRLNIRFGAFTGLSAGWFWIAWDLLGQSTTSKVAIGEDQWLFLRAEGEGEDARGLLPWTDGDMDRWLERLEEWCAVSRASGVPLVIAIAPNKSSMLRARMPVDEVAPFESTRYRELLRSRESWPAELQAAWLDLHETIEACGPESSYFRTDTHWNYRGADCAAEAIGDRLASVGVVASGSSNMSIREETIDGGDLARMLGVAERFTERIEIPSRLAAIGGIEDLQAAPAPPSSPRSSQTPRVLLIHDSFGMILRDPLTSRFPGAAYERGTPESMTGVELASIIERESPDAVVISFVERRLTGSP